MDGVVDSGSTMARAHGCARAPGRACARGCAHGPCRVRARGSCSRRRAACCRAHRPAGRARAAPPVRRFLSRTRSACRRQSAPAGTAAQVVHLAVDALHQRAGVEVVGQHHHLAQADQHLPLHHALQPRPGDAGEGQVHQLVVAFFLQPARHLGHVAVGATVGRAPAQQHHAGGGGVGHVQRGHGLAQAALEDGEDGVAGAQVRAVEELDAGCVLAGVLDGLGNLHLGVTGGIQDQWQHQHAARRPRRGQQAIVQRGRGKFDEADLDAPGRLARAPLVDEDADFLVAGVLARAVAHQQDRGVIHVVAFLKRCVKPGS
jgi:hypothetical protein